nr:rab GTPase-binding effector protein 1-like [Penaeus vannamei]
MERERKLLEEHTRQEADFGLRRAKLKELYLQKEEELRLQSDHTRAVEVELEVLRAQVRELQEELEEARSAVTIAQCTAENDIAVEQRKCQEEIATVQQLMKVCDEGASRTMYWHDYKMVLRHFGSLMVTAHFVS